jgi:hypothetical protein
MPDVYKDVSYTLDDDEYSAVEYQDMVRKRFVKSWENIVDVYRVRYLIFLPYVFLVFTTSRKCSRKIIIGSWLVLP